MHAVLITSPTSGDLALLAPGQAVGSLPACGKSLLAHALDDLATAGIATVDVYAGSAQAHTARELGSGRRWGLRLRHLDSLSQLDQGRCGEGVVVVDADCLRRPLLADVLSRAGACADRSVEVVCDGVPAGVWYWPGPGDPDRVHVAGAADDRTLQLDGGRALRITCAADLLAAQRMALSGEVPGLLLEAREVGAGRWLGVAARASATTMRGTRIFVGARSWIEPGVEIGSDVTVGADVVVDRGARLADCVVLDSTWVGEDVELRHAVVGGGYLVRTDAGIVTRIEDPFLLAPIGRPRLHGVRGRVRALVNCLRLRSQPQAPACSPSAAVH